MLDDGLLESMTPYDKLMETKEKSADMTNVQFCLITHHAILEGGVGPSVLTGIVKVMFQ